MEHSGNTANAAGIRQGPSISGQPLFVSMYAETVPLLFSYFQSLPHGTGTVFHRRRRQCIHGPGVPAAHNVPALFQALLPALLPDLKIW